MKAPQRGEVWLVDLGLAAKVRARPHDQHPADDADRALVTLVPHTTRHTQEGNKLPLPPFTESGDLPLGVHPAALHEVGERFGSGTRQRRRVFLRLERLYAIARGTGHLARMIVFGSFVTTKAEPNDVDVFLLMADDFDVSLATGETRLLFDHLAAEAHFGASIFWLRRLAAFQGEQAAVEYWQVKRDGQRRGVVEIDLGAS